VLAFEPVSRPAVIEGLEIPFRQDEVFAVVLGVAVDAFQARTGLNVVSGVQSFPRPNAARNVAVTIQTVEGRFSSRDFVAGGASGHAINRLVRAGKRTRRNLGCCRDRSPQYTQHNPPEKFCFRESANTPHAKCVSNRSYRFVIMADR
jgi:hypothetical protein